jgi:hypothetical protein
LRTDHLERDDLDLADQLLAHVEAADEVGRNADIVRGAGTRYSEMRLFRTPLPSIDLVLLGVEGGRVVLEVLDQRARLGAFIEDLGLAFVDAATAVHGDQPWLEKRPSYPWLLFEAPGHPLGAPDEGLRDGRREGSDPQTCD